MNPSSPRILVIDDEPAINELIGSILGTAGYEVDYALNGREGIDKFEERTFQAVVTDLWMPVMDGISTVVALRVKDKNVPIVLMSGLSDKDEFISVATQVGANCILRKPFSPSLLLQTLTGLLEHEEVKETATESIAF